MGRSGQKLARFAFNPDPNSLRIADPSIWSSAPLPRGEHTAQVSPGRNQMCLTNACMTVLTAVEL
jgi:hypothetical protein